MRKLITLSFLFVCIFMLMGVTYSSAAIVEDSSMLIANNEESAVINVHYELGGQGSNGSNNSVSDSKTQVEPSPHPTAVPRFDYYPTYTSNKYITNDLFYEIDKHIVGFKDNNDNGKTDTIFFFTKSGSDLNSLVCNISGSPSLAIANKLDWFARMNFPQERTVISKFDTNCNPKPQSGNNIGNDLGSNTSITSGSSTSGVGSTAMLNDQKYTMGRNVVFKAVNEIIQEMNKQYSTGSAGGGGGLTNHNGGGAITPGIRGGGSTPRIGGGDLTNHNGGGDLTNHNGGGASTPNIGGRDRTPSIGGGTIQSSSKTTKPYALNQSINGISNGDIDEFIRNYINIALSNPNIALQINKLLGSKPKLNTMLFSARDILLNNVDINGGIFALGNLYLYNQSSINSVSEDINDAIMMYRSTDIGKGFNKGEKAIKSLFIDPTRIPTRYKVINTNKGNAIVSGGTNVTDLTSLKHKDLSQIEVE